MSYYSYAELFGANPDVLAAIRTEYGQEVYTDDNEVVDPSLDVLGTDYSTSSTVAVCQVVGTNLIVTPDDGVLHPILTLPIR